MPEEDIKPDWFLNDSSAAITVSTLAELGAAAMQPYRAIRFGDRSVLLAYRVLRAAWKWRRVWGRVLGWVLQRYSLRDELFELWDTLDQNGEAYLVRIDT